MSFERNRKRVDRSRFKVSTKKAIASACAPGAHRDALSRCIESLEHRVLLAASPHPDLVITGLVLSSSSPMSGQTITLSWNDVNNGLASASGSWTDRISAVNNTTGKTVFSKDVLFSGNLLTSGHSAARKQAIALPAGQAGAGDYVFSVTADLGNTIVESNSAGTGETNNTSRLSKSVKALAPTGTIRYVDVNAVAGNNTGASWANAYLNLQSALAAAVSGDTIEVAKGTYYPTAAVGGGAAALADSFTYANGALIGNGGWTLVSTGGAGNPPLVVGGQVSLGTTGEDAYRAFNSPVPIVAGKSLFTAADVNFSSVQAAGDYFLHLATPAGGVTFYQRLFAESSGAGLVLGIGDTATTPVYGSTVLSLNTTYRVVMEWDFQGINDVLKLYVNPTSSVASNNTIYSSTTMAGRPDPTQIEAVNLRQGTAANAPAETIDNLIITPNFPDAAELFTDRTATFQLKNGVTIQGGYAGVTSATPDARNVAANVTALSGDIGVPNIASDNSYHVVTGSSVNSTAVLDGFTITGGEANGGGTNQTFGAGVLNISSSAQFNQCTFIANATVGTNADGSVYNDASSAPVFSNCTFSHNTAQGLDAAGAAMANRSSSPQILNCSFVGNVATGSVGAGGAIFNYTNASPVISNCSFINNSAVYGGGAIYNQHGSSPNITSTIFSGNSTSGNGGAIVNDDNANPLLTNCIFIGNSAANGGAIAESGLSAPQIVNCTFATNMASAGGAIYNSLSSPTIANSILWSTAASSVPPIFISGGTTTVSYCDVQGGYTGSQNLNVDPQFIRTPFIGADNTWGTADDDFGDVRLQNGSPAIDHGNSAAVPSGITTDLAGAARIVGASVDMGAYEQSTIPTVTVSPTTLSTALAGALLSTNSALTVVGSTYVGSTNQGGTFGNFNLGDNTTTLSASNGIVLTTGSVLNAPGPNIATLGSTDLGIAGDSDLTSLLGVSSTHDANVLTINFTIGSDIKSVLFDFIFASEEFPRSGSSNDGFGVYLDGTQIAFDANHHPISVNNNPFQYNNSTDTTSAATSGKTRVGFNIHYNGLTARLTTQAPLNTALTTHTLKFAIADAVDGNIDTAVFLAHLRGSTLTVGDSGVFPVASAGGPYLVANGGSATLDASGTTDTAQDPATLTYRWDLDGDGVFGETGASAANGNEIGIHPVFNSTGVAAGSTKSIALQVIDANGQTSSATTSVRVIGSGGPYAVQQGLSLSLHGAGPSGGIIYSWDLNGDGAFNDAIGLTPILSWSDLHALGIAPAGSPYTVSLRATSINGTSATASTMLTVVGSPDLQIQNMTVNPSTPLSGQSFSVNWDEINTGTVAAAGTWNDLVEVLDAANNVVFSKQFGNGGATLGAGASIPRSWSFTLADGNAGVGSYTARVIADSGGTIAEFNDDGTGETNNTTDQPFTSALAPYPDLQVSGITINPSSPQSGQQLTINWNDVNDGTGAAMGSWYDFVELIDPATNTRIVYNVATYNSNNLAGGGGSAARSLPITLPDGAAGVGDFQIRVTVDWDGNLTGYGAIKEYDSTGNSAENNNATTKNFISTLFPYPDLQVGNLAINPSSPQSGQQLTINWNDVNNGVGAATGTWFDFVELIDPATNTRIVYNDATYNSNNLAGGGGSAARSLPITLPDGAAGVGDFQIRVTVDWDGNLTGYGAIKEYDSTGNSAENNNATTKNFISTLFPYPDLQVGNLAINPSSPQSGQQLTINWNDVNNGVGAATGTWFDFVELIDPATNTRIVYNDATYNSNNLAGGGGSAARSLPITLPDGAAGVGDFQIRVTVDWDGNLTGYGAIKEYDSAGNSAENNNATTKNFISTAAPAPDLTVVPATPAAAFSGHSIDIGFTVTNNGDATTTGTWTDTVYLSPVGGGADTQIGLPIQSPKQIAPGQSYTRGTSYLLPAGVAGTYRIIVITNSGGTLFENNTANNTGLSNPFTVTLSPYADLQVTSVDPPAAGITVTAGGKLSISFSVKNFGTGATDSSLWYDDVYLSTNPTTYSPSDFKLQRVRNPSYLNSGESYPSLATGTINTGMAGDFYVYVVTDATNTQAELSFDNNNVTRSEGRVTIVPNPAPAIFTVNKVTVNPLSGVYAGSTVLVTWEVQNTGGEPITGNWYDSVGISTQSQWVDPNQALQLQPAPVGRTSLAPGEKYTMSANVTLPGTVSGAQYLIVDPDHGDSASGTGGLGGGDVQKGTGSAAITILVPPAPKLHVSSVTAINAQAGTPTTVNWTVVNDGFAGTNLNSWTDAIYYSSVPTLQLSGPNKAELADTRVHSGSLAAAMSYPGTDTFTVPYDLNGQYYVFVRTDVFGQVPFDDSSDSHTGMQNAAVTVAPYDPGNTGDGGGGSGGGGTGNSPPPVPWSDLAPTNLAAPSGATSGLSATFNWTVQNAGPFSTAASAWRDHLYISGHNGITGSDVYDYGAIQHYGAIGVGGAYTASATVQLPDGISGQYFVILTTNSDSAVTEPPGATANDTLSTPFNITARLLPKLQVSNLSAPASITSNTSGTISWTVTNNGPGPMRSSEGNWVDEVFLSNSNTLDGSQTDLGPAGHTGILNPGDSYTASITPKIKLGISGAKYIIVVTDWSQQVYESADRSGDRAARGVSILAAPVSLLTVGSISASPINTYANQPLTVSWTVTNDPSTAITNVNFWNDSVYLSKDQFLDPNTQPLISVPHFGALAPGASYTATTTQNIPAGASGAYYVFVVTDHDHAVYQGGITEGDTAFGQNPIFVQLPQQTDLATSDLTAPSTGVTGEHASPAITWKVTNLSGADAVGSWTDAVYLSLDNQYDSSDLLVDRVQHNGGLGSGQSYTGSTSAPLPAGVVPADYHVIVRADTYAQVRETDKTNNQGVSNATTRLDVTLLTSDVPISGSILPDQDIYYRIFVQPGQPLKLSSQFQNPYVAQVYLRYGQPPTLSAYDQVYSKVSDLTQTLSVANTKGGTYYVMLHGAAASAGGANYSVTASVPSFGISGIDLTSGSNAGQVTVALSGALLDSDATVKLVGSDLISHPATRVLWKDESTLWVTFDLTGLATGNYSVIASQNGQNSTLPTPFTVNNSVAGTLQVRAVGPGVLRSGTTGQVTFFYSNTGNTDIPAPLLLLSSTGASLTLSSTQKATSVQFLGTNSDGPAGILPPGFEGSVTYKFALNPFQSGDDPQHSKNSFSFQIQPLGDLNSPIDWGNLKSTLQPSYVVNSAWDGIWQNFIASVGSSVGDLQNALDETATYLSQLNRYSNSEATLLQFKLLQADAALLPDAMSSQTDLAVPATGLPLDFSRSYFGSISSRNRAGMLGLGWLTPWDTRLVTSADGSQIVDLPTGQIQFSPSGANFVGPAGAGSLVLKSAQYVFTDSAGTRYGFGADGSLSFIRDKNGNQITAAFTNGRITTLSHTDGTSLAITYNAGGTVDTITASNGLTAHYAYDSTGDRLASLTTALGTMNYTYVDSTNPAVNNALLTIAGADGTHTTYKYDTNGRRIESTGDVDSEKSSIAYGANGEVTITDAASEVTKYLLTELLKPGRITDPLGNATRYEYDAAGNPTAQIRPGGLVYSYGYNSAGQLASVIDPLGAASSLTYAAGTNLISGVTDARGNVTHYTYDANGNLTLITQPDGKTQSYSYDALGNALSLTNSRSQATSYTYNSAGQLMHEGFADGSQYDYTYDAHGNLKTAIDATGTTTFTYDANDRLSGVSYPGGHTLAFSYDATGRRSQMVDQTGFTVNYNYDDAGRLISLTNAVSQTIAAYTYDSAGRLSRQDDGNGTYTTITYDSAGNVLNQTNFGPSNAVLSQFAYAYDALNRATRLVTLDGSWDYTYDGLGQLSRAQFTSSNSNIANQDLSYTYDVAGNRTSTVINGSTAAYVANNRDEIVSVGGTNFSYDADGNLISDGVNSFTYDALNRLTSITTPGGTTTYAYNALGQRVTTISGGQASNFVFDPVSQQIVGQYGSAGATLAQNVFGLGLIASFSPGATAYFGFDANGSTSDITSAGGAVASHFVYNPFGSLLQSTGSAALFQFLGQTGATSSSAGVILNGARSLDSAIGASISATSGALSGGLNAYSFDNSAWSSLAHHGDQIYAALTSKLLGSVASHISPATVNFSLTVGASTAQTSSALTPGETTSPGANPGNTPPPATPTTPTGTAQGTVLATGTGTTTIGDHTRYVGRTSASKGYQSVAIDPNNVSGPQGYGATAMVGVSSPQLYRIDFENTPDASAPAQIVNVQTQLDSNWDLRTLQLQTIVFDHHVIDIPPGLSFFSDLLDLRPQGTNLIVSITAGVDTTTGKLTWKLSSIDPTTGEPPTDPNVGLLPPDNDNLDGEGYVTYTIRGRRDVNTGAIVTTSAVITFDDQPAIQTNVLVNTLDTVAPTTSVTALPATTTTRAFDVQWSGQDDVGGSGVAAFDVDVSVDGKAFTPWLQGTTLTSSQYIGAPGHTYAFYAIAFDNAGNPSAVPSSGQAHTTIPHTNVGSINLFYNDSTLDGLRPAADTGDDSAIASDKHPLLPGQRATFANYTSYDKGINGIMVDVAGALGDLSASDFTFKIGNNTAVASWTAAPRPQSISIRPTPGVVGSQRVTIIWADNAIKKEWLQVAVLANDDTGLAAPNVFYYGNAVGDSGNSATDAVVNASDALAARAHASAGPVGVGNQWDYNRDGVVDNLDVLIAQQNATAGAAALQLIDLTTTKKAKDPTNPAA